MNDVEFMRAMDAEYRATSGLSNRRYYSIFYSRVCPSPLLILGINSGGSPDEWTPSLDSDEFRSRWQHEYVDERYPIQAAMLPLPTSTLGIDDDIVRRVPKTNVVFRRSTGESAFEKQQGMTMWAALQENSVVLSRIVQRVAPKVILFEGMGAFERFSVLFAKGTVGASIVPPVMTPNGRYPARIYEVRELYTSVLNSPVTAIILGHPSKYAGREEFAFARADMRSRLVKTGEELRLMGSPLL